MKNRQFDFWKASFKYIISNYGTYRELKKNYDQELFEKYTLDYAKYVLEKIDVTYEIIGQENLKDENYFFVSNHGSMFDSYFTYLAIKKNHSYFIAKELEFAMKIPIVKNYLNWANAIFVDRSSLRAGLNAIKEGERQLINGNNLCIFAEGEVTDVLTNGEEIIAPFHSGSFKPAALAKKPVVPITIVGSNKIHNTNSLLSRLTSGHVKVIIGKPIYDFCTEDNYSTNEMSDKAHLIIFNTLKSNLN